MDGVMVIHSASGHLLFSKAYSENFGIESNGSDASPQQKDPMVASMLLANFLCAFYTNAVNLIEDPQQHESFLGNPLQSFDCGGVSSGANGGGAHRAPVIFFRRHPATQILVVVFLKRALFTPTFSSLSPLSTLSATFSTTTASSELSSETSVMHRVGEWFTQQVCNSFVQQFTAELNTKPFRAQTKTFKSFGVVVEKIYTSSLSTLLLQLFVHNIRSQARPSWLHVIYSSKFLDSISNPETYPHHQPEGGGGGGDQFAPPPRPSPVSVKVADASSAATEPQLSPVFIPSPSPSPSSPYPSPSPIAALSSTQPFVSTHPPSEIETSAKFPFALSSEALSKPVSWYEMGKKALVERGVRGQIMKEQSVRDSVGRTSVFMQLEEDDNNNVVGEGQRKIEQVWLEEERAQMEVDAALLAEASSNNSSTNNNNQQKVADVKPSSPLPSSDALMKLSVLIQASGQVLSSPSELHDEMHWMELHMNMPPSQQQQQQQKQQIGNPLQKIWVFRCRSFTLAFPMTRVSSDQSDYSSFNPHDVTSKNELPHVSFHEIMTTLFQPFLQCWETHWKFVRQVQEKQWKLEQKAADKAASAQKPAK